MAEYAVDQRPVLHHDRTGDRDESRTGEQSETQVRLFASYTLEQRASRQRLRMFKHDFILLNE
jgi:hypothetical protein